MPFRDPRELPFVPIKWSGHLPHLYKPGCTYFITTRLIDAVLPCPRDWADRTMDDDVTPEELMEGVDPPICLGSCLLKRPEIAELVQGALLHYVEQRYQLHAWCIMPNHVHLVIETLGEWMPDQIMRDWKGYTSRMVNQMLDRAGPLWERESFDHLIRTYPSMGKFVAYTQHNPVAAGLCRDEMDWTYSSRTGLESFVR